jgi:regulator of sigma E protease
MLSTILIFLAILAILVLAHEAGHFWVARRNGVRVDEFGFGFPPRLLSWKKGQTRYSINLIPLGGFVKIHGEQGEGKGDKDSFASKPAGARAKILVAGVLMNFILAMALMSLGNIIGMPGVVAEAESGVKIRDEKIQVTGVLIDSPAERAGFQAGDVLVGFKNESEFQGFIKQNEGQNIEIKVARGKEILNLRVVPKISQDSQGPVIGVGIAKTGIISYPVWRSFIKGVIDTVNLIFFIIQVAGKLIYQAFLGEPVMDVLAGPVGIYKITSQAAGMGFAYILNLVIFLSVQLGIINILPFPALDGGRLFFLGIEKIKGKPVSQKIENIIHAIGFALLMLLMVAVTWRDIIKFF